MNRDPMLTKLKVKRKEKLLDVVKTEISKMNEKFIFTFQGSFN